MKSVFEEDSFLLRVRSSPYIQPLLAFHDKSRIPWTFVNWYSCSPLILHGVLATFLQQKCEKCLRKIPSRKETDTPLPHPEKFKAYLPESAAWNAQKLPFQWESRNYRTFMNLDFKHFRLDDVNETPINFYGTFRRYGALLFCTFVFSVSTRLMAL